MNKIKKIILSIILGLGLLVILAIWNRHYIFVNFFASEKPYFSIEELEKADNNGNAKWFDDWYTVEEIAENVYAIGEPRYFQRNYNYLIVGEKEAILFDAGPGIRDINKVVKSITNLPYTLLFSHLHYDHLGNGQKFDKVGMIDLPHIRERAENNYFTPESHEHLGKSEKIEAPKIKIGKWIKPDEIIDLGGRKLQVIYTPGHTSDGYSLYDSKSNILFSGDWFTEGLGPMVLNSSMQDFLKATEKAMCKVPKDVKIYPAHKYINGLDSPKPLTYQDLVDTKLAFDKIKNGELKAEGFFPAFYKVNQRVSVYSDITFFQSWDVTYPKLFENDCK